MGFSKGSKGGGKPKAKAAPIARPSHDYKALIEQREYSAEEKVEREELRRLEAKSRQLAREAGFSPDLGAAGVQWDRAAKLGSAGPPPGSGCSGKDGGKGGKCGKGGGKRGGKSKGAGKSKFGGSGQISRAATPLRNQGHLPATSSQAWANYAGLTTPVGGTSSSSRARPAVEPAVARHLAAAHQNRLRKAVLRSAADVASSSPWEVYSATSGTAPVVSNSWHAHGGSADVPAYRGGSVAAAPTAAAPASQTSISEDAPPWNGTSWHDRPWHDNTWAADSSWSDEHWKDDSWNRSQADASTSSSSTGTSLLFESKATSEVNNPLDGVETMRRERVGNRRPQIASGKHCEVLKHSEIGCAVVSLESSAVREALMTSIEARCSGGTPEMTIGGVLLTVQRHTDKETGLQVENDIFLGWGRGAEKSSPLAVEVIATAIDETLAGLILPKPPADTEGSEDQRRKFKTYLWHMAAQSQVQKGKIVLRMAAAANQVKQSTIEAVIAEFEANSISQSDDFEADDYDDADEYDDTGVGTDFGTSHVDDDEDDDEYVAEHFLAPVSEHLGGESAETASYGYEHADTQQACHVSGADNEDWLTVAIPDDNEDWLTVAIPDTDSDDDLA